MKVALLRSRECATPVTCLTEVVDVMLRLNGADPERLSERLGPLLDSNGKRPEVD